MALADPVEAIELIRVQAVSPGFEIEDLGRVSDTILTSLNLGLGQFMRA